MKYTLYKIRPGKRLTWESWCNSLFSTYRSEAIDTLREENLKFENCYIIGTGDESYALFVDETLGEGKKVTNMDRQLNRKHLSILTECLERVPESFKIGYELNAE